MSRGADLWTDEVIARLRDLWAEGHSTREIGRRLGITKNAVVGKAHRVGLARPSPIKPGGPVKPRGAPAPVFAKPTLAPLVCAPLVQVVHAPVKITMRAQPCCWPLGHPRAPDFRFCGAPGVPGKPYCAEHRRLSVVSAGTYRLTALAKLERL